MLIIPHNNLWHPPLDPVCYSSDFLPGKLFNVKFVELIEVKSWYVEYPEQNKS